jgi:hypothetical protein
MIFLILFNFFKSKIENGESLIPNEGEEGEEDKFDSDTVSEDGSEEEES